MNEMDLTAKWMQERIKFAGSLLKLVKGFNEFIENNPEHSVTTASWELMIHASQQLDKILLGSKENN